MLLEELKAGIPDCFPEYSVPFRHEKIFRQRQKAAAGKLSPSRARRATGLPDDPALHDHHSEKRRIRQQQHFDKPRPTGEAFRHAAPVRRIHLLQRPVESLPFVCYNRNSTCIEHSAVLEHGVRVWKAYETLYMDGADFEQIGADFERTHPVPAMQLGGATVKLMSHRDLVDHAVQWITDQRGR